MAEVNKSGEMVQFIKEHLKIIWPMVKEDSSIQEETSTKETGVMTRPKEKAFICTRMDQHILDNGLMISSMDLGNKNGLMVQNIRETSKTDSNKVMETFYGLIVPGMKVNFI